MSRLFFLIFSHPIDIANKETNKTDTRVLQWFSVTIHSLKIAPPALIQKAIGKQRATLKPDSWGFIK